MCFSMDEKGSSGRTETKLYQNSQLCCLKQGLACVANGEIVVFFCFFNSPLMKGPIFVYC